VVAYGGRLILALISCVFLWVLLVLLFVVDFGYFLFVAHFSWWFVLFLKVDIWV